MERFVARLAVHHAAGVLIMTEHEREISELRRTVATLDKAYTDACMDKRALEGRVEQLTEAAAKYRAHIDNLEFEVSRLRGVESDDNADLENLLQAAERDLDAADATIAEQRATIARLEHFATELTAAKDENTQLRDIIVYQASVMAGATP